MALAYPFTPTPYHQELYDAHEPLNYADADNGYHWFVFTGAVASMFDQIETYARDQDDGTPGWGILLDIDRCPDECLQWLGQFVGVVVPNGMDPVQARTLIRSVGGFQRGSTGSLIQAAQTHLTGSKTVYLRERDPNASAILGGAYGLTLYTLTGETPDPTQTEIDAMSQKAIGLVMVIAQVAGNTYLNDFNAYATYTDMDAAFLTYNGMTTNQPGT